MQPRSGRVHEQRYSFPWHCLYFFPDPHGHGSLRPIFSPTRLTCCTAASPRRRPTRQREFLDSDWLFGPPRPNSECCARACSARRSLSCSIVARPAGFLPASGSAHSSARARHRHVPDRAVNRTARTPRACTPASAASARNLADGCPGAGHPERSDAHATTGQAMQHDRPLEPENESRPTIATFESYDSSAAFTTSPANPHRSSNRSTPRALQRDVDLPVLRERRFRPSDVPLLLDRIERNVPRNMSVK